MPKSAAYHQDMARHYLSLTVYSLFLAVGGNHEDEKMRAWRKEASLKDLLAALNNLENGWPWENKDEQG